MRATQLRSAAGLIGLATFVAAANPVSTGDPIPHGSIATGSRDIAAAWLCEPTCRYAHGVLGDDVEASALCVTARDGTHNVYRISDRSVFEDLTPRLADIDRDERDEVWVVRSDEADGARLEAYGLVDGRLTRRYAAEPIGRGYRWLNPIGIADLDGDGKLEAAYVETPHIGGMLTIVRPDGQALAVVARRHGYSNHDLGSTRLDLATITPFHDERGAAIMLPTQDRRRLVAVELKQGKLTERWRSGPIPAIAGRLHLERHDRGWTATYLTPAGQHAQVAVPRLTASR